MKYLILNILIVFCSIGVYAQKNNDITLNDVNIHKVDGKVQIQFKAEIGSKATKSNYKLTLIPILYKEKDSILLKPIVVYTRKSKIVEKREQISAGKHSINLVDEYKTTNKGVVDYSYTVPYAEWMNGGAIYLKRVVAGCCTEKDLSSLLLAENIALVPTIIEKPAPVVIVKTQPIIKKWQFSKKDMIIDFSVSRTYIDLNLFENKVILDEVVAALQKIRSTSDEKIEKIEITGYASPEGSTAFNMQLGEGRSTALKAYLMEQIPELPESAFVLINGGVNWKRLRDMIVASDMKYKEQVLHIIDNVPAEIDTVNNVSRKKALMDLKGGIPYNYMLKNFFPKLRNACYIGVYYMEQP